MKKALITGITGQDGAYLGVSGEFAETRRSRVRMGIRANYDLVCREGCKYR